MKEAEVVKRKKKKKLGVGRARAGFGGRGAERPAGCGRTPHHLHQPFNALSWSWDSAFTHRSTRTEEGLWQSSKERKFKTCLGKASLLLHVERSGAGPLVPASQASVGRAPR